jgi:hypothetical protein
VFHDSFPNLEREIQSAKRSIPLFEILNYPQRVQIVVEEKSVLTHESIKCFLARVSKWRMADVMRQRECLDQVNVQPKLRRNGTGNLCDFYCVGQPVTEMVGIPAGKNLGFGFQPSKSPRVNDSVAIALEIIAVGMRRLGMAPAKRLGDSVRGKYLAIG